MDIEENETIIRIEVEKVGKVLSSLGLDVNVNSAVEIIKEEIESLGNPGEIENTLRGRLIEKRKILSELEGLEDELERE